MPVTEFECAIAKSQIGRYLAGDNLGGEVVRQLESHIGACPKCKTLLEERRKSLVAMLDGETPIAAAIRDTHLTKPEVEEAKPAPTTMRERFAAAQKPAPEPEVIEVPVVAAAFAHPEAKVETNTLRLEPSSEVQVETTKKEGVFSKLALFKRVPEKDAPALTAENIKEAKVAFKQNNPTLKKPMMYAAGLAVVIAGMSYVVKDPTQLLGPRATSASLLTDKATKKTNPAVKKRATSAKKNRTATVTAAPAVRADQMEKGTRAMSFAPLGPGPEPETKKASAKRTDSKAKVSPKIAPKAKPSAKPKQASAQQFVPIDREMKPAKVKASQKSITKRPTRTATKKKINRQPRNGTVRVYGADGAPIN